MNDGYKQNGPFPTPLFKMMRGEHKWTGRLSLQYFRVFFCNIFWYFILCVRVHTWLMHISSLFHRVYFRVRFRVRLLFACSAPRVMSTMQSLLKSWLMQIGLRIASVTMLVLRRRITTAEAIAVVLGSKYRHHPEGNTLKYLKMSPS